MRQLRILKSALVGGASALILAHPAAAKKFDIPDGDLATDLGSYARQSGVQIFFVEDAVRGRKSRGAKGDYTEIAALNQVLRGTGFAAQTVPSSNFVTIVPQKAKPPVQMAAATPRPPAPAAPTGGTIETVTVTAEKMSEDVQTVPIAVTAVTQKEMTINQIAGGPDLIKSVPNLTFSKTNFSGYNIEIRGIGTQAISVTTDPAVAVALNGIPFIRNHFFEQEFYDLSSAEILRGPQGTLYGRNATAGVVNILSAKPTDEFAAMASVDFGNYDNRRYEAMVNMPIVDDRLDIRVAGEWTKRDGYSTNTDNNSPIDGRDLWSSRVTIGWKPTSDIQTYLVWEHFSEDDNRMRSAKQLCQTDPGPTSIEGVPLLPPQDSTFNVTSASFSQGCLPTSLYSRNAFEVPNGFSLPFISGAAFEGLLNTNVDPYASTIQSTNLRDVQSAIAPTYKAKSDTLELNTDWEINQGLTLVSQTGFSSDFLFSSEDYNRFDTSPGVFQKGSLVFQGVDAVSPTGVFCDPQLGCSNRLVLQDLSTEHAWQLGQELRLTSSYSGPFNFSFGGNYLHYETEENYYVFANTFTMISLANVGCNHVYIPNVTNNLYCLNNGSSYKSPSTSVSIPEESPQYIDPNPITSLDNQGHNYFLSQNPYTLNSYAIFGETYYSVTDDLKLTGGLRWTDDRKHFVDIPSELLRIGYGYPTTGVVNQSWSELTGRFAANWSPKLAFTDQSMFYASYARGYKAGGANPPGAVLVNADAGYGNASFPTHPLTFKPEFIDAFELGTKNTLLDDTLTLNADVFYYKYRNYQISQIVDRSAINLNFDASVKGAEVESDWEPLPGLRFTLTVGYQTSGLANGSQAIDLIDRTAGNANWVVMKPSVGQASNCVFPTYVAAAIVEQYGTGPGNMGNPGTSACGTAYVGNLDPITLLPYVANPVMNVRGDPVPAGYIGFDPSSAPNGGQGFAKNLSGNQLPNAPHFTTSFTAQYTIPVSANWAATLHGDFYWQANSWARVENDRPYDVIHGYATTNVALNLNDTTGWQVQAYVKNLFNVTAITGDFLNSDDSGLTTNVFLTDPRLFGVRVTRQLEGADVTDLGLDVVPGFFADADGGRAPLWIELGGQMSMLSDSLAPYAPPFVPLLPSSFSSTVPAQKPPAIALDYEAKVSFEPEASDWVLSAGVRYGRSMSSRHIHKSGPIETTYAAGQIHTANAASFIDVMAHGSESHLIVDFMAGKDLGLGAANGEGTSVLSGGIRIAQFTSGSLTDINSDPDYHFVAGNKYHDVYNGRSQASRSFRGIGPSLALNGSTPILGRAQDGELDLDWGANAAVLFGRQRVGEHHQTSQCHVAGEGNLATCAPVYTHAGTIGRSRTVAVPNFGGFGGFSVRYLNAKVSFGYRADEYFGAMDGGQDSAKSFNRGFFGPYANISIGLGG